MACIKKGCTLDHNDERMIICWLCHGLCHFKCSGLSGLVAESISKHKSLHWRCNNCQQIGAEFFRFFQSTKDTFLQIRNNMVNLSNQINEYGKLFEDYKTLENLKSPVESSPKRRKSPRIFNKDNHLEINGNDIEFGTPCGPTLSLPKTAVIPDKQSTRDTNLNNCNTIPSNIEIVMDPTSSTSSNANRDNVPKQLIVIPSKKSIFVSRFAAETSTIDIDHYIKTKLNFNADISSFKFSYSQPRDITSFKIMVPNDLFEKIVNPGFWPENTVVHEYVYKNNSRANNIVRLPSNDTTNPKN